MNLKSFLDKYGTNKTTNFDLMDIARDLNLKVKVLMKDELLEYKGNKPIILNYQNSNQSGSHWVCLKKDSLNSFYFDSYGIIPLKEVFEYLNDFTYSTFQIQPDNTEMCGQLCLLVLKNVKNIKEYEDTVLNLINRFKNSFLAF